jgi:hypothetical protein
MSTISTTINHGITLGNPGYLSPLTVTGTGAVNNNGTGKAIFGGNATVVNYGEIVTTGNSGGYGYHGAYLGSGYVNNHGTITASGNAVLFQAAGTVVSSGFIYGHRWGVTSRGLVSVTNTGTISGYSQGIVLSAGGLITNSDLIAGSDGLGIGEVTLYHIELETHDGLLANGTPAELFQNANIGWDHAPKPPCAEVLTGGPIVDAVWRQLRDRTGARPRQMLTDDPDLHLLLDGCRLDAVQRIESAYIFSLPATASCVRVVSRAAAPAELGLARDSRVLGVALRRIVVRAGNRFRIVNMTDDRLAEGFHGYEADGDLRWTDGDAVLPVDLFKDFVGRSELVLHVGGAMQYRADARSERDAA